MSGLSLAGDLQDLINDNVEEEEEEEEEVVEKEAEERKKKRKKRSELLVMVLGHLHIAAISQLLKRTSWRKMIYNS